MSAAPCTVPTTQGRYRLVHFFSPICGTACDTWRGLHKCLLTLYVPFLTLAQADAEAEMRDVEGRRADMVQLLNEAIKLRRLNRYWFSGSGQRESASSCSLGGSQKDTRKGPWKTPKPLVSSPDLMKSTARQLNRKGKNAGFLCFLIGMVSFRHGNTDSCALIGNAEAATIYAFAKNNWEKKWFLKHGSGG